MYDELVKRLNYCRNNAAVVTDSELVEIAEQAADAIEELASFKEQIMDGHFYCAKDGVLYRAELAKPKGNVIQLPPIEFAEPPKEEA